MEGERLGPYAIDRELGSGGMGRVYAARLERPAGGLDAGSAVALKVVHPHLLETEGFFKRFLREAEIGKSVHHENVVRTLDCDAIGGSHFLVMEYVEGQTLRDLADELGNVPEELCRHVAREVTKGLGAIHAAGVVHRDLKPENVLITPDHQVKVMDLGVARLADESIRLSQTGAFVGSLHYAAPESFRDDGKNVDGRADLHALGLVLYELSCGANPYLADDIPKTVHKVLHEEPRRLGDANPQLSPFFEELVHCLLAKDCNKRFADAAELLAVLDAGEESTWWRERASMIRTVTKRPLRRIRIPRETAVYGREDELEKLRTLYDRAKAGEGQVVLVEGEAGIGKSRLIDELVGRLQSDGEDLNFLFGSYPPSGAATASGAWSTAFREQFGNGGSADYLTETPLLVPAFDALLSGDAAPSDAEPLTTKSIGTCFVHATRALARERTTIVLIEDLHFAPDEARGLFTALALAVPAHRVLLVGTTRPGVPEDWQANLTRLDHVQQLPLHRLGPKDLAALLRDSFRSERLAEQLAYQVGTKSDGNPFFVFEIIRGLREGQFITRQADGTWISTRVIDEIQIPSSVLDLVNARVADLTDDERNLLDVASCWGFEFDPALVGSVLGLARISTLQAFARIEKRHRLARSAGRDYVFDHHQVQEALYGALNEQLREEYHGALAEALETSANAAGRDPDALDGALCVDLCEHFLAGAQGARAVRYLEAAQTHLAKGYLHAQVVALTERALAVPGLLTGAARADVLLRLTSARGPLDASGRRVQQEACAREAELLAEEAGDDRLRGQAANTLGNVLRATSRYAEAHAAFRRALHLSAVLGNKRSMAAVLMNQGTVFHSEGRLDEAREYDERGLALSREIGDRASEARITGNLGNVFHSEGRMREAREHYERGLALSREIGDREGEAVTIGNLGNVLSSQGSVHEAREYYERGLALSREIGDRASEARTTGNLGVFLRSEGCLLEAREQFERSLALTRETGNRFGEAVALVNLGPTWHALGDRLRAGQALDRSIAMCREIGAPYPEGYGLLDLGRLADEEGDTAEAQRLTEESLTLRRKIGHGDGIADALIELGDLHRRAGDVDAARGALTEAVRLSREQGRDPLVALALALLACVPGGDARAAETALAEAGDAGESPRICWLLHQATGDRAHLVEAKRLLDEALAKVPEEYHEGMLTNLRVNREIMAAWKEHGP